ncbi:hypothetical protein O0L34_g17592 [Tuta absoluta]|nr:hypothetical protein O0L34_g17592 [Tuta absoluta]
MAPTIKYTILLAVAITAAVASDETPQTTTSATPPSSPFDSTQFKALNEEMSKFRTCLKDLLIKGEEASSALPTCTNTTDAEKLKGSVIEAVTEYKTSANNNAKIALDLLMNVTVQNKDILTPVRVQCINDTQEKLKVCMKKNIPGMDTLANELGSKDLLTKEMTLLNFQPANLKKAQDLQKCINDVWKSDNRCTGLHVITDQLFKTLIAQIKITDNSVFPPKKPSATDSSSAGKTTAGSILLFASLLLLN